MKVKLSQVITSASGKLGGSVFRTSGTSVNSSTKTTGKRSYSTYAYRAKNFKLLASKKWRTITQAVRDDWNNFARTQQSHGPLSGKPITTGFQIYQMCSWFQYLSFGSIIEDGPLIGGSGYPKISAITYDWQNDRLTVTFSPNLTSPFVRLFIYASKWKKKGYSSNSPQYRIVTFQVGPFNSPITFNAFYASVWGSKPPSPSYFQVTTVWFQNRDPLFLSHRHAIVDVQAA